MAMNRKRTPASRIDALIRSDFSRMRDYMAGPSLAELGHLHGLDPARIIKLDAGENPYGPSARVRTRLSDDHLYYAYPDMDYATLRRALGAYTGLGPEFIFVGCGADEILDISLRLILDPGDKVINCPPTFGVYDSLIYLNRGVPVTAPRRPPDYRLDLAGILKAIDRQTKAIMVCTPNNPTGNGTPERDLVRLLNTGRMLLVDEAYFEFGGETIAPLTTRYENLIVIRTLSKWASLAGLRLGYGIASPAITERVSKVKPPYNVSVAAQVAALASLNDLKLIQKNLARIKKERARLTEQLQRIPGLKVYPSLGNFVFVQVCRGDAAHMRAELERQGIFLRYYDGPLTGKAFRITIGTPPQNRAVSAAFRALAPSA